MNNVMDMLTKSGYEAISIGNDVLPCTLKKGNELVGFLMEDFSVQLLPEHEAKRDSLNKAVSFALDNQGLETIQDEFQLSRYQNIVLTTAYDFEEEKPIYNIYSIDKDKNLVLLNSSEDKDIATRDFASRSGLVNGEIPTPAREADRIGKFIDAIKAKGYSLAASAKEAHIAYEIVDQDNNIVGYIGKNNRVTITTDNAKTKRFLTDTYIDTNPNKVMLPSFFEKLKERLKEIGLALKVIFTAKGRHYAIQNEQHKEIATVSERHEVTYTDLATKEQMAKVNAMVEEIQRENQERRNPQEEQSIESVGTNSEVAVSAPVFTTAEMKNLVNAVLSDTALTNSLSNAMLSSPNFLSQLNEDLAQKLQTLNADIPQQVVAEKREVVSMDVTQPIATENTKPNERTPLANAEMSEFILHGFEADDVGYYAKYQYSGEEYRTIVSEQAGQYSVTSGTHERVQHNFNPEQTEQYLAFEKQQGLSEKRKLSVGEIRLSQEFDKLYGLLQTLDGFNPQEYDAVKAEMIAQFGTAHKNEFEQKLQRGDYKEPSTLSEKLKASHEKADRQNTVTAQERTTEQTKEQPAKERE